MVLKQKEKVDANEANKTSGCYCNHCISIRKQQKASEQRWINVHRQFDR